MTLVLAGWLVGCQPTTSSPFSGERVGRTALAIEAESWLATHTAELEAMDTKLGLANLDLDEQEELRASILAWAENIGGRIPGVGAYLTLIFGGGGLLTAIGVGRDNRRKDKVIRTLKNGATP